MLTPGMTEKYWRWLSKTYHAKPCSYHFSFKNCRDDLHGEMGCQLRERFEAGGLLKG